MSKTAKDIVRSFYETDLIHNSEVFSEYLHPEIELYWNSSFGFNKKDYSAIKSMFKEMSVSFESLRCEISHLLTEGDVVTIRYTYFVKTIEQPDQEEAIAHFITIWELKENKLHKGYQISQQGDTNPESLKSFISK
ncbi:nuclear transport factor 2 family protein [Aquimarina sp. 2201CG5-10]|uniref:nuclear transport factor 2 family protein n=1 Tax=Aquimarina callyspongiae TaxID=3098150 RepID=UPI002AB52A62|nr:nuclear transport factor 2 family protein [Aquimarina sp. 2201CG5-10]MDY8135719.1 nuclear transport factor 2 family protein [Aquimarina sp. 2201CG5-10]